MNWVKTIAAVLVLWSSTAWGATLAWDANREPDLAGYRIYQCSLQPCTKSSGNASLLVTLGTGTSFNIGTPTVTQYYFITAYDFANHESVSSNLATVTPAGSPPPPSPPPVGKVSLTIVGNPATGPWGVTATTTDQRNVMAHVRLDGVMQNVEYNAPYDFFPKLYGRGPHTVEFVFYLENTTTEIGRASITVIEGSPAPSPPPSLTFDAVSNSATGNTSNSISWTHTVGSGTNRFLEVCTQARDSVTGDVPVLTVTANGRVLTKVRRDIRTDGGNSYGAEIWHLLNPASGANTITVGSTGPLSEYGSAPRRVMRGPSNRPH